jgi:hypothetical protein
VSAARAQSKAEGAALAGAVLFGFVVIYALSIGPVAYVCDSTSDRCEAVEPALRVFYAPLIWLHGETPLGRAIEWYVELWSPH